MSTVLIRYQQFSVNLQLLKIAFPSLCFRASTHSFVMTIKNSVNSYCEERNCVAIYVSFSRELSMWCQFFGKLPQILESFSARWATLILRLIRYACSGCFVPGFVSYSLDFIIETTRSIDPFSNFKSDSTLFLKFSAALIDCAKCFFTSSPVKTKWCP